MGLADGTIKIFLNINDNNEPVFDSGSDVQTFLADSGIDVRISVGGTGYAFVSGLGQGRQDRPCNRCA